MGKACPAIVKLKREIQFGKPGAFICFDFGMGEQCPIAAKPALVA